MNNFDLRKFLTENKLTSNSRDLQQEEIDNSDWANTVRAQNQKDKSLKKYPQWYKDYIEEMKEIKPNFLKQLDLHLNKIPSDATKVQLLIDDSAHRPEYDTKEDQGALNISQIKKELIEGFQAVLRGLYESLEDLVDEQGSKYFASSDKTFYETMEGLFDFEEDRILKAMDDEYEDIGMYPVLTAFFGGSGHMTVYEVLADKPLPGSES